MRHAHLVCVDHILYITTSVWTYTPLIMPSLESRAEADLCTPSPEMRVRVEDVCVRKQKACWRLDPGWPLLPRLHRPYPGIWASPSALLAFTRLSYIPIDQHGKFSREFENARSCRPPCPVDVPVFQQPVLEHVAEAFFLGPTYERFQPVHVNTPVDQPPHVTRLLSRNL